MTETIFKIVSTAFLLTGTVLTVLFLACMIIDEERKGVRK